MKRFAALYDALDRTTSTNAKVAALVSYFSSAPAHDAAWALYFLTGGRIKRLTPAALLRAWALDLSGVPEWLFDESLSLVGDFAETIALLLGRDAASPTGADVPLSEWVEQRLLPLRAFAPPEQQRLVCSWWQDLDRRQLFLLNKLLTGAFRVGVSATLVTRALAQVTGLPPPTIAHRLMGQWQPSAAFFQTLSAPGLVDGDRSRPYPFYLASPLDRPVTELGGRDQWLVEWKWDGIRAQLIRRDGAVFLWSRGEELITDRFPELRDAAAELPNGTVLDGEVLAFRDGRPLPFALLQRRIGRQRLTTKILADAPVVFMAFDLLEHGGKDMRTAPLRERRQRLEAVLAGRSSRFELSPALSAPQWSELAELRDDARARNVEGLMLKDVDSPYRTGRKRGEWWKWKIDPFSIDTVLVYAQPGHGRRATLFTDYTFAVWQNGELLPIAKAYSGLSDAEIDELDRWIRQHTIERFGPVRAVEPVHVFELAFEALALSSRHRSGIAVRFPRIARWRRDKTPRDADTLEGVMALLNNAQSTADNRESKETEPSSAL